MSSEFLSTYRNHVAERAVLGIPPLPLSVKQTAEVIDLLKTPPQGEAAFLVDLIIHPLIPVVAAAPKGKAHYTAEYGPGGQK